ncbi:MAG: hypothetical protein CMF50_10635 [Legionellales bacterium]|nr:hypothetical protein [Legionellales bacterium]|tara:strand:- start:8776 stop:9117 length:342 start_codon:yes stop_codon:yes gene_type:complete
MWFYGVKILITALLVVAVSEVARRSTIAGAVLASIPLVSFLAIVWLYIQTKNTQLISQLSQDIVWLVLPSLVFFIMLPWLLRHKWHFSVAISLATVATIICYLLVLLVLRWVR